MLTAKLLVPLGAPLQLNAGETLSPVQPKPLNTCSLAMVPPSLMSELVKVMLCAFAALEPSAVTPSTATQRANFVTAILPSRYARDWLVAPGAGMSNSNFWDCLEANCAMRRFSGSMRYAKDTK